MYSLLIRFALTVSSFSLSLPIIWLIDTVRRSHSLQIYFDISPPALFKRGIRELWHYNYLLFLFGLIVLFLWLVILGAKNTLSRIAVDIKSIKPAGINFTPILFTIGFGILRINFNEADAYIIVGIYMLTCLCFALVVNNTYHYNPILAIFFRYTNYEIQTKAEVTYLLLSKKQLLNKSQVKEVVRLSQHMLLLVEPQKTPNL
jgi:hypothetical protein